MEGVTFPVEWCHFTEYVVCFICTSEIPFPGINYLAYNCICLRKLCLLSTFINRFLIVRLDQ